LLAQADAARLPLPDRSVDLVFGSPPYMEQRTYGIAARRKCEAWVEWMLGVTAEALRVTRGAVIWVVAGSTKKRRYQPGPEMLLADGWRRGWGMEAPCYWARHGISGSGGDQWFKKVVEYCLCFKAVDKLPWSCNTARGHAPKFSPGGKLSHRKSDGVRVNLKALRQPDGSREVQGYKPPRIANPGNLISTGAAGGGNIGHHLAHENEAPFPEALADFFVASLCPPSGVVLDPFVGSGTTLAVASRLGRFGVGLDIRGSQCELSERRIKTPSKAGKRAG
jgi:site-specific DNA-methyltransferase (adenine-specific)/site-specific DNA-methyltransferase (cytosine-N4-specific)